MRRDQRFLVDKRVIQRIVSYAQVCDGDVVLEIGAGGGNLTRALSERASKVYAIEIDPILAEELRKVGMENVEVICGDALKVEFPEFNKVVSNIPYTISSEITFKLLRHKFEKGILTYQKEFAERMVAEKGSKDYSRLSVAVQYFAKVRILEIVPRTAFRPPPKVDSAVVELIPSPPPYEVKDVDLFMNILSMLFSQRRKLLRNSLKYVLDSLGVEIEMEELPFTDRRVEELDGREIALIANRIWEATKGI